MNCHICDAVAEVTLTEGRLNILEVHSLKGQPLYDWTGGGSIKTNFCKDCFSGWPNKSYLEVTIQTPKLRENGKPNV